MVRLYLLISLVPSLTNYSCVSAPQMAAG